MTDQQEALAPATDLAAEIDSSLSSVWARYVGSRPSETEVELETGVVRWVLPDAVGVFAENLNSDEEAEQSAERPRTLAGYERETAAVVAKATGRKVTARITKANKKTGAVTETFILDAVHVRH